MLTQQPEKVQSTIVQDLRDNVIQADAGAESIVFISRGGRAPSNGFMQESYHGVGRVANCD